MSRFFVSCPMGYEEALIQELKNFWFEMIDLDGQPTRLPMGEVETLRGGIELDIPDHLGFQINFFSKLANRVLLRITKFEARYYDQFEKSLGQVEFEKFLDLTKNNGQIDIKIETHKSRLNNEKNLIEAATNALKKKKINIVSKAKQVVFLRAEKDRFIVSLDTSGEHLHRRGYAEFRGEAPLRETLAAYLVQTLKQSVNIDSNLVLVDPFVGSGTLLFEAISNNLPQLERVYSWLDFKSAPKLFKSESWKKNYRWFKTESDVACLGFDIDEKAIKNLEHNKELFQKIFHLDKINLSTEVVDSSDLQNRENLVENKAKKSVWAITNPPYGVRMADDRVKTSLEGLEKHLDGLIVIHPNIWKFRFEKLKLLKQEDFTNQGLELKLSVYTKLK